MKARAHTTVNGFHGFVSQGEFIVWHCPHDSHTSWTQARNCVMKWIKAQRVSA